MSGSPFDLGERITVSTVSGPKAATYDGILPDVNKVRVRWHPSGKIAHVEKRRIQGWRESVPMEPKARPSARARAPIAGEDTRPMVEARAWDQGGAKLQPVPKPAKPSRSKDYLAFVREHACAGCRAAGPSDPHHFGARGMGQKTDDHRTVPLCRRCHDHFHDHGRLPHMDPPTTKLLLMQRQLDLLVEWARQLEGEAGR